MTTEKIKIIAFFVAEEYDKVINKMLSSINICSLEFSGGVEYKYRLRRKRNFVKILT